MNDLEFEGRITKLTHVKDVDGNEVWKLKVSSADKHAITLVFDEEPDYPLGSPVTIKISVTQTKLVLDTP